jgi:hypothetical protein
METGVVQHKYEIWGIYNNGATKQISEVNLESKFIQTFKKGDSNLKPGTFMNIKTILQEAWDNTKCAGNYNGKGEVLKLTEWMKVINIK